MSPAWRECPISTFLATGGGIGLLPFAPGTWGSLEGLLVAAYVDSELAFDLARPGTSPGLWRVSLLLVGFAVLTMIAGLAVSGRVEEASGVKDPSAIVIDEVAGQLFASAPTAMFLGNRRAVLLGVSFALFRLFDIWKPGPIRKLQDLPGGWGIMLDDVAAGLLAGAMTLAIGYVI